MIIIKKNILSFVMIGLLMLIGIGSFSITGCKAPEQTTANSSLNTIGAWKVPAEGARYYYQEQWLDSSKLFIDTNGNTKFSTYYDSLIFEREANFDTVKNVERFQEFTQFGNNSTTYYGLDPTGDIWIGDSGWEGYVWSRYPGEDTSTGRISSPISIHVDDTIQPVYGTGGTPEVGTHVLSCLGTEMVTEAGMNLQTIVVHDSSYIIQHLGGALPSGSTFDTLVEVRTSWVAPSLGCYVRERTTESISGGGGSSNIGLFSEWDLIRYVP